MPLSFSFNSDLQKWLKAGLSEHEITAQIASLITSTQSKLSLTEKQHLLTVLASHHLKETIAYVLRAWLDRGEAVPADSRPQETADSSAKRNQELEAAIRSLQYCKINRLFDQERAVIGTIESLNDALAQVLLLDFKNRLREKELEDLKSHLKSHLKGPRVKSPPKNEASNSQEAAEPQAVIESMKSWAMMRDLSEEERERRTYDVGLGFVFMDRPDLAFEVLDLPPISERKLWLAIESGLIDQQPARVLSDLARLKQFGFDSPAAAASMVYAQARAFAMLGDTERALELFYSLRTVSPDFKLTEMFIAELESASTGADSRSEGQLRK